VEDRTAAGAGRRAAGSDRDSVWGVRAKGNLRLAQAYLFPFMKCGKVSVLEAYLVR
jgi:hypothetical protein